jgi:hypothetical protein
VGKLGSRENAMRKITLAALLMSLVLMPTVGLAKSSDDRKGPEAAGDKAVFHRVTDWFSTVGRSKEKKGEILDKREQKRVEKRAEKEKKKALKAKKKTEKDAEKLADKKANAAEKKAESARKKAGKTEKEAKGTVEKTKKKFGEMFGK